MDGELLPTKPSDATDYQVGSWPLWAKTLVARIQSGYEVEQARNMPGSMVSLYLISRHISEHPGFARAWLALQIGRSILGADECRALARDFSSGVLMDAVSESRGLDAATGKVPQVALRSITGEIVGYRDAPIAPRDRVTNRRLVLEVGGHIGAGAQGAPTAPIIQVGVSVHTHHEAPAPKRDDA